MSKLAQGTNFWAYCCNVFFVHRERVFGHVDPYDNRSQAEVRFGAGVAKEKDDSLRGDLQEMLQTSQRNRENGK